MDDEKKKSASAEATEAKPIESREWLTAIETIARGIMENPSFESPGFGLTKVTKERLDGLTSGYIIDSSPYFITDATIRGCGNIRTQISLDNEHCEYTLSGEQVDVGEIRKALKFYREYGDLIEQMRMEQYADQPDFS